jgi:hypothetical protein
VQQWTPVRATALMRGLPKAQATAEATLSLCWICLCTCVKV